MLCDKILIIYQPGLGGHFLSYLFSLDPSTVPHIIRSNDVDERLKNYDFNNSLKYQSWFDFHNSFHGSPDNIVEEDLKGYEFYVSHDHANKVDLNLIKYWDHLCIANLSYDEFACYWLVSTIERWKNWPTIDKFYMKAEETLRKNFPMIAVNVDDFLYPWRWEQEYVRVCNIIGIPLQLDSARKLYQSWYKLRVKPLHEEFELLTQNQKNLYIEKRKQLEKKQTPHWESWYNNLKGESWPECRTEEDFISLPEYVKNELIEKFGYIPKENKVK